MQKALQHRALPITVLILLFSIQAVVRFQSNLVGDASWFLYVADGLLHGKNLYSDYVEVNPPLAIWLMVPVAWFAGVTALGLVKALYWCLLVLTAASIALVYRYISLIRGISQFSGMWLCVLIAGVALFLPAGDFGEREHLMVLLFMPWLFLRLARAQGARVSNLEAVAIGVLAAIAICFKPQSVLAPASTELLLLLRHRRWLTPLAAENIAAVVFVICYAAVLFVAEPEFLHMVIGLGMKAYVPFYGYPAELIWFGSLFTFALLALALLLWWQTGGAFADIIAICTLTAAGFLLSYFVQYKGFSYQILPALVFSGIACAAGVIGLFDTAGRTDLAMPQKALLGAALMVATVHFATQPQACVCDEKITGATIATYSPAAKSVFIASVRVGSAFPLILNEHLVWASRLPASWLTPYVASKWQDGPLPADEIVAHALDWAVSDLASFQPDIVFVDESTEQLQVRGGYFNYVKFWSNDQRFAAIWSDYERRATINGFAAYTRR